jgi:phosphoribosylformylglycinamidine synthase subunit PurQ / glutaminase
MTRQVRVMVLAGNGINCEMETAHACKTAGADQVDIVYLWDLASGNASLDGYDMLCLPGGFLDGDDLGSARASAIRMRHTRTGERMLAEQIEQFAANVGLVIGICNGFQLMVKLGLLPRLDGVSGVQQATLTFNDCGRFEDRWVELAVDPDSPCVFTRGLEKISLPIRHGEGKLVVQDEETLAQLNEKHRVLLRYINPEDGLPTEIYPHNPNGSAGGMASLTDATGRIFGLMPHPEGFLHRTNHPQWTRRDLPGAGDGLALFKSAVDFIRDNA